MTILKILKIRNVKFPERGTKQSSGIDFFVPNELVNVAKTPKESFVDFKGIVMVGALEGAIEIEPFTGVLIPTGIKCIITPGYDLVFDNKSGVCVKKGLIIGAKIIDSDYRGEIHIHLINTSDKTQKINLGDKIAQAMLRKIELDYPIEISNDDFESESNTERGEGGFGSTGSK